MRIRDTLFKVICLILKEELLILHNIGIRDNPRKGRNIFLVIWNFPLRNWIKVNIDGATRRASGHASYGGIFRIF